MTTGFPKSLTAIVHVRFHYKELETKPVGGGEIEIMSRILDQASELPPKQQEILVKFADYLNKHGKKVEAES